MRGGRSLVEIDGSMGEGGGQILRTSIALSAVTGRPVRVYNIRAKRSNPGLRPQHLTAVRSIAEICGARVKGAEIGSMTIEFYPGRVRGGEYLFDVGTAGSVSLVLQALLPALAFADRPVRLAIKGGTDVPLAPTIDYVREVLLKLLNMLGYRVSLALKRRGHYPRGGGIVEVEIEEPPGQLKPRDFVEIGGVREVYLRSHAVRLPRHVAERQASSAERLLRSRLGVPVHKHIEFYEPGRDPHLGPGSGIAIWTQTPRTAFGSDSLGAKGKRAETVGEEAASKFIEDINTGAPLDRHASDMIPVYLSLTRGVSRIKGARLTRHAITVFNLLELIHEEFGYEIKSGPGGAFEATIKAGFSPP